MGFAVGFCVTTFCSRFNLADDHSLRLGTMLLPLHLRRGSLTLTKTKFQWASPIVTNPPDFTLVSGQRIALVHLLSNARSAFRCGSRPQNCDCWSRAVLAAQIEMGLHIRQGCPLSNLGGLVLMAVLHRR